MKNPYDKYFDREKWFKFEDDKRAFEDEIRRKIREEAYEDKLMREANGEEYPGQWEGHDGWGPY